MAPQALACVDEGRQDPMIGEKIRYNSDGKLDVPDRPIIPYIEGDGVGPDIWKASVRVFDAVIKKCYGAKRKIHWLEVYAGEKGFQLKKEWAPEETIGNIREKKIGITGTLTHP